MSLENKGLSINYEIVKSMMKTENLSKSEVFTKLKLFGYSNFLIKYDDALNRSVLSDILSSSLSISSLFYMANLGEKGNYFKVLEIIDFCYYNKIKKIMLLNNQKGENQKYEEFIFNLKQNLRSVVKYANLYGVEISIENFSYQKPFCSPDELLDILKGVKDLKIVFDTANCYLAGQDVVSAFDKLYPYISNIHLKDVIESAMDDYDVLNVQNKPYNYCPLSSGKAFVDEVFKKSRELNFKGEYYLEGNNLREMEKVLSESSLYYFSNL